MSQIADDLVVYASAGFFVALLAVLAVFAVAELLYRRGSRGARFPVDRLVGLIFAFVAPFGWVWFGALDIHQSLSGFWAAGDFRSSDLFVTLNWGVILVIAPLTSLFGLYILWSTRHQR
jgi:hypothetical protein